MDGGYAMTPQVLKKNATDEEYAIISENLAQLPGVDTSVDWERNMHMMVICSEVYWWCNNF